MIIVSKNCLHPVVWIFLTALLTACGSNTTVTSSTVPSVFYSHSVAFSNAGTGAVMAWGADTYGQLGINDTSGNSKTTPQPVLGLNGTGVLTGIGGISAGGTHTLAFDKNNGNVYAWGNNGFGQLGDTTTSARATPVQLLTLSGTKITAVSAGGNHSLAIDNGGNVWAWGANTYGQLGDGTVNLSIVAKQVISASGSNPTVVSKISAGGSHSLALLSGGTALSWGYNGVGQLGNKVLFFTAGFVNYSTTTLPSSTPKAVVIDNFVSNSSTATYPILTNITDIAAGGSHSLFLVNDGINPATATVWACGNNAAGQLGLGDLINRSHGVKQVVFPAVATSYPIQVAAGLDHSLALMKDGKVWEWGLNIFNSNAVTKPVQVVKIDGTPLSDVTKIVATGNSSYAVDNKNQLWAWGENTFGQLGNATTNNSNVAMPVVSTITTSPDLYHP